MKLSNGLPLGIAVACAFAGAALARAPGFQVVHDFGAGHDGLDPTVGMIAMGGQLYGTTMGGGAEKVGAVYKFDPATGAESVVYSFTSFDDGLGASSLIAADGLLYGTTLTGGLNGYGTVFSIDPATGTKTVLYAFPDHQFDAFMPTAGLIKVGGVLYGTTQFGGKDDLGTVFSVHAKTGKEAVLHSFTGGSDGEAPMAGLLKVGGLLYGTTVAGGNQNCYGGCGTVFSIDPSSGTETVLYAFQGGNDGAQPQAGLINVGGTLYGTTTGFDAPSRTGAVFSLTLATNAFNVVYTFANPANGSFPAANLLSVAGKLYGTTENGGTGTCDSNGCGTVFSVDPASGTETVLQSLSESVGVSPTSALIKVGNRLYGTAFGGGTFGGGTIFAVKP